MIKYCRFDDELICTVRGECSTACRIHPRHIREISEVDDDNKN